MGETDTMSNIIVTNNITDTVMLSNGILHTGVCIHRPWLLSTLVEEAAFAVEISQSRDGQRAEDQSAHP